MKLSLQQTEIEAAIRAYITNQGISTSGKTVTCDFTMGRKGTGLTVEVDISAQEAKAAIPVKPEVVVTAQAETEEVTEVEVVEANPGYSTSAPVAGSLFGSN